MYVITLFYKRCNKYAFALTLFVGYWNATNRNYFNFLNNNFLLIISKCSNITDFID